MTTPIDPLQGLDYNDQVKRISELGLTMPEKRTKDAVAQTLLDHIAAGGSITPPDGATPQQPGVVKIPAITCPSSRCGSTDLNNYGSVRVPRGRKRYYVCRNCGRNFTVVVEIDPLSKR